jgi:hypothetical protein
MALSYTQNLEDYHLSLALADQSTGFYIDVGAGHPIADNVSFWFYERGWKGIVVEKGMDHSLLRFSVRWAWPFVGGPRGKKPGMPQSVPGRGQDTRAKGIICRRHLTRIRRERQNRAKLLSRAGV